MLYKRIYLLYFIVLTQIIPVYLYSFSSSIPFIELYFKDKQINGLHKFACDSEILECMGTDSESYSSSTNLISSGNNFIATFKSESVHKIGIVLDLKCGTAREVLRKCSDEFFFATNQAWLLFTDSYNEAVDWLKGINISLNTDMSIMLTNGSSSYILYDVYKIHYSTKPIVTPIAIFNENGRFPLKPYPDRTDLMGFEFPVVLVLLDIELKPGEPIDVLWDHSYYYNANPVVRYTLPLFMALKEALNMSFTYKIVHEWGVDDGTGKWTGMIGELQRGGCEFSLNVVKMRKDSLEVMDNIVTLNVLRSRFIFHQPKVFGSYKALVIPMNPDVWYSIGGFVLLFILVFILISSYDESEDFNTFGDVILLTLGTLAQQDFNDTKMFSSSRMTCFTLLLLSFTACVYYNAAVLKGLLSPTPNSIRTLDELLDSNMKLGVVDAPYTKNFESNESVYGHHDESTIRLINKIKSEDKIFYTFDDGLDLVKNGRFAFFVDEGPSMRHIIRKFTDSDFCLAYIIEKNIYQNAISLRKYSPYKELLARKLIWMLENGLRKRAVDNWLLQMPECQWSQEAVSIGIEAVIVAFVTLFLGMILSIIIFFFEVITFKKKIIQFK